MRAMSVLATFLIGANGLAAQDKKDDLAAQLEALDKQHAQETQEFWKAFRAEKSPQERGRLIREKHPDRAFLPRYRELAERANGETAAAAWVRVVRLGSSGEDDLRPKALERLTTAHMDSPLLEEAVVFAGSLESVEAGEKMLRRVLENSPHPKVKAAAQYTLATLLMGRPAETTKAEARRLLEGVVKDFKDTEYAPRAEGYLFELDHLQIGKVAPDFEATDQEGRKFKLSDYRGKVVVIDFWGYW